MNTKPNLLQPERILFRKIAVKLDYAAFFTDPDAAKRGNIDIADIGGKTTCTANSDEDDS